MESELNIWKVKKNLFYVFVSVYISFGPSFYKILIVNQSFNLATKIECKTFTNFITVIDYGILVEHLFSSLLSL